MALPDQLPVRAGAVFVSAADNHEPNVDSAAILTYSAAENLAHCIGMVAYSYDGDPTVGSLTILDGTDQIFKVDITGADLVGSFNFSPRPLKGTEGNTMTITLLSPQGQSGIINAIQWTE